MNKHLIMAAAMFFAPVATQAQVSPSPSVDPSRLAAARSVIDQIFPPATRAQMIGGMMATMTANIRQSMIQNTQLSEAIGKDARVRALFDRFMDRQMERSNESMQTGLPGMVDAMARAYARRFDVAQLHELSAFFATPTGRVYTQASMTIMSDPDVAAWQRNLMASSMSRVQEDVRDLTKQILALSLPVAKP